MAYKRISPQPVIEGGTSLKAITAHNLLVGNAASAPNLISPSSTSGVPLISQGSSADPVYGTAVVAGGGTGDTSFTSYAVLCGGTTSTGSLQNVSGVGTSGQILTSNGAAALPTWQNPSASSISITGNSGGALTGNSFTFTGGTTGLTFAGTSSPNTETLGGTLVVSNGGTGDSSFTAYSVVCGGTTSTGVLQNVSGVGTSGQVLTSNGAAALPTWQAVPGTFVWNNVTGTSQAMSVNNGYIANNASLVTMTLPSTAAVGSVLAVAGSGAAGWTIAQNSGQTIHFGNVNTTTGAGGSLSSSLRYDSIKLVCNVANTDFVVLSSIGNITYV